MSNQWKKKCRCTVSRYDFYILLLEDPFPSFPTPKLRVSESRQTKINGSYELRLLHSFFLLTTSSPSRSPLIKERSMRDLGKTLGFHSLLTLSGTTRRTEEEKGLTAL